MILSLTMERLTESTNFITLSNEAITGLLILIEDRFFNAPRGSVRIAFSVLDNGYFPPEFLRRWSGDGDNFTAANDCRRLLKKFNFVFMANRFLFRNAFILPGQVRFSKRFFFASRDCSRSRSRIVRRFIIR